MSCCFYRFKSTFMYSYGNVVECFRGTTLQRVCRTHSRSWTSWRATPQPGPDTRVDMRPDLHHSLRALGNSRYSYICILPKLTHLCVHNALFRNLFVGLSIRGMKKPIFYVYWMVAQCLTQIMIPEHQKNMTQWCSKASTRALPRWTSAVVVK